MANEIDILMDLDPLELSSVNIEQIISYHRANRAKSESGIKPSKESGPKVSLDSVLGSLVKKAPPVAQVKRRV